MNCDQRYLHVLTHSFPTRRSSDLVALLAAEGARRLGGRTMVLTTTLRALRAIGEELQRKFEGSGEVEVLVQGQWPKRRLIERRSEEHTSELQSLMRISYAVFCLKKKHTT